MTSGDITAGNPPGAEVGWASTRQLVTLLDWMGSQTIQRPAAGYPDRRAQAAASLLDGATALLRLHRTGTGPDGRLHCSWCLPEGGSDTWPCQTVRVFGTAVLRHWGPGAVSSTPPDTPATEEAT